MVNKNDKVTQVEPEYDTSGWLIYRDEANSISYKYPETFSTKYIHTVDWPPTVQVIEDKIDCLEAGAEGDRAGLTVKNIINNHEYCVTIKSEGAAGSTYNQYAYSTRINGKTYIYTFTTRMVQCANYNDPEKTMCEEERKNFDLDTLVDHIIQSTEII